VSGRALAAAALGLVLLGCKAEPEIGGVDRWHVERTRLDHATGRCIPDTLADGRAGSYCFGQQPIGIRGMPVDVDLYFAGTEPDARLVELQLKVGGCRPDELESWLRKTFGAPFASRRDTLHAWKNRLLYAAGFLPLADEPGRCLVRIVPAHEDVRWRHVWGE
jgi:hypothetical protein